MISKIKGHHMFVVFAVAEILFCIVFVYRLKFGIKVFAEMNNFLQSAEFNRSVRKLKVSSKNFRKFLIERKKRKDFEKFVNIFELILNIAEKIIAKFAEKNFV